MLVLEYLPKNWLIGLLMRTIVYMNLTCNYQYFIYVQGDNNQLRSKISELTLAKAKYEEESARYRALYEHEYKVRDNIVSQLNSDHYYVVPALANKSTAAQDTSPTPANTEKRQQDASLMDSLRYQLDKSFAQHLANGACYIPNFTLRESFYGRLCSNI